MGAGARISKTAKEKGISLRKLAEQSGIPYSTLYSITKRDSNKVNAEIAQKVAAALNIDVNFLIYGRIAEESRQLFLDKINGTKQFITGKKSGNSGVAIGGQIKHYRGVQQITQAQLSEKCGIPLDKIKLYEEDASNASQCELEAIATALNVTVFSLLDNNPADWQTPIFNIKFNEEPLIGDAFYIANTLFNTLNNRGLEAAIYTLYGIASNPTYRKKKSEGDENAVNSENDK